MILLIEYFLLIDGKGVLFLNRKFARESAFKIIYAMDVGENTLEEAYEIVINRNILEEQREFILSEVNGVKDNQETIDKIIEEYSHCWRLERIPSTDRNILRLAIYEILFREDIPISVSINEAVNIAKKYGGDQNSYKFINGLLGTVSKEKTK